VNVPSERDQHVAVRAYLTDETFGYTHWRAAQFSAPDAEVKRWAILTLFDSREARDAAVAKLRAPADPPVSDRRLPDASTPPDRYSDTAHFRDGLTGATHRGKKVRRVRGRV
jgi:hypothetical protein